MVTKNRFLLGYLLLALVSRMILSSFACLLLLIEVKKLLIIKSPAGSFCNHYFLQMLARIGNGYYDGTNNTGKLYSPWVYDKSVYSESRIKKLKTFLDLYLNETPSQIHLSIR